MSSYYLVPTPRGCRAVTADERVRELEDENARLRRLLEDGPATSEDDITQAMIQAGRYAANLNDGTLASIYLAMRKAELSANPAP